VPRYLLKGQNEMMNNDPCLDCGTPTLGTLQLDNGTTIGIGINRLPVFRWGSQGLGDEGKDGYLCGECAGYECDSCGKNIYLDEDITISQGEHGANYKYHEECLTPELRLLAIEQGELSEVSA
jgi:hypothetical protein